MLFKKKKKQFEEKEEKIQPKVVFEEKKVVKPISPKTNKVSACEKMVDAARDFENARSEYERVKKYIGDLEKIEKLAPPDKKILIDTAAEIIELNKKRDELLNIKCGISDSQFELIQEYEDEIPRAIRRLEKNEKDLETVQKDLKLLEGEKTQMDIARDFGTVSQKNLRLMAIAVGVFFAAVVIICTAMRVIMRIDTSVFLLIGTLLTAIAGAYIFVAYQREAKEIKDSISGKNKAITLENRVKIKYVNIKNAVDYTYEKYNISNSREFIYTFEEYQRSVKNKESFMLINEELEYNGKKMLDILERNLFYDPKLWQENLSAIADAKELEKLKRELLSKKQKLRGKMKYSIDSINALRSKILVQRNELGEKVYEVNRILAKVAQLNMEIESEDC